MKEILTNYNLGRLVSSNRISDGYANANYKIVTTSGNYFLKICHQNPLENILEEIKLLNFLKSHHFPTAYPIMTRDGTFHAIADEKIVILYEYIEGYHPKPNITTVTEIAKATGALNALPFEGFKKKNYIDFNIAKSLVERFEKAINPLPDIFDTYTELINQLEYLSEIDFPVGIIHSDIFPDNTLFQHDRLLAIVDFEEFCIDSLIYDVAMTINGFCFINNKPDLNLLNVFIDQYQRNRLLQKIEKKYLMEYIRWTAVTMASWHLRNDLIDTPNSKQESRVRELLLRAAELQISTLKL